MGRTDRLRGQRGIPAGVLRGGATALGQRGDAWHDRVCHDRVDEGDGTMGLLLIAALVWVGVHVGVAGTRLRAAAVARLGERGFLVGFSLLSVASIVALCASYNAAPLEPVWIAPDGLRWALALVMLAACVLLVGSVAAPNPTAAGGRGLGAEPRGITRLTRHPMLWAFALWAGVHVLGNGDVASMLFFGAFLVTALAGMPSIDAKIAARDPAGWRRLARGTSIVPGAAIAQGRNRLVASEIGWMVPAAGLALWLVLLFGHRHVVGVAPVPG